LTASLAESLDRHTGRLRVALILALQMAGVTSRTSIRSFPNPPALCRGILKKHDEQAKPLKALVGSYQ